MAADGADQLFRAQRPLIVNVPTVGVDKTIFLQPPVADKPDMSKSLGEGEKKGEKKGGLGSEDYKTRSFQLATQRVPAQLGSFVYKPKKNYLRYKAGLMPKGTLENLACLRVHKGPSKEELVVWRLLAGPTADASRTYQIKVQDVDTRDQWVNDIGGYITYARKLLAIHMRGSQMKEWGLMAPLVMEDRTGVTSAAAKVMCTRFDPR